MRRGHSRDQDLGKGSAKNLERMPPRSAMSDARVESIRNEMKESSRLRPPLGSKQTFSHSTCWPRTQTQSKHAQTSNRPGWSRRDACINVCVFVSLCACVYVCAVKQKIVLADCCTVRYAQHARAPMCPPWTPGQAPRTIRIARQQSEARTATT
jgi:hypothetical protein